MILRFPFLVKYVFSGETCFLSKQFRPTFKENLKFQPYPNPPQYGQPGFTYPAGQMNYPSQPYPNQGYPGQGYPPQPGYHLEQPRRSSGDGGKCCLVALLACCAGCCLADCCD
ncbi:unnamed protein product [Angiostrongylus costaricensis]|uniref:CYSTM domain-containing protein n=1 Tax=Angiostrongylus costaricensis TaxID=334426 RepID=A0A0R3PQV0_ANGCS|nr:unnamed protein product [Angiostrongylus costaricensis]